MSELSIVEQVKLRLGDNPAALETFIHSLTEDEIIDFHYNIEYIGRPKQQYPDGDWATWLILAGRGFGKSFVGAHTVNKWAKNNPGCRIALVGETVADVRDVMIRGDSGIIKQSDPRFVPLYEPSKRLLTWDNGSIATTFSGEEPNQMRGPQFHYAWVDEIAKYTYQTEVWDMLQFCMRLGTKPRVVVTTTPRPTELIKTLAKDPSTHVTTGSTFENTALPPVFLKALKAKYEGTRLGQQELYAAILDDNPGAIFKSHDIQAGRIARANADGKMWVEQMDRLVVAIDPATTNNESSDETGIIVAGRKGDEGFIFSDVSARMTPNDWGQKAVDVYKSLSCDLIVGEVNQGGQMVESIIKNIDRFTNYKAVRATRGKAVRAEPIAALYEQHRIHHVGYFAELEDQMCSFDPSLGRNQKSPDRLDALVWALTELFDVSVREPQLF